MIGGHLTLAGARRLVAELRHEIAQGRDPGAVHMIEKARRRDAALLFEQNTFEAAVRDFVAQHASKKTRRWQEQRARPDYAPRAGPSFLKGLPLGGLRGQFQRSTHTTFTTS